MCVGLTFVDADPEQRFFYQHELILKWTKTNFLFTLTKLKNKKHHGKPNLTQNKKKIDTNVYFMIFFLIALQ